MDESFITIDIPEEAFQEEYPIKDFNLINDVFLVGESPLERWRCYINGEENWRPSKHHDKLISQREYHARQSWEMIVIISICGDYTCKSTLEMLRDISVTELRKVEFEMMSYQLTCGMIGISGNRQDLYRVACVLHLITVYITNIILGKSKKTKQQQKIFDSMVEEKPIKADNKMKLSVKIDKSIFAIQELIKHGTFKDTDLKGLCFKLKDGILAFDSVAVVT